MIVQSLAICILVQAVNLPCKSLIFLELSLIYLPDAQSNNTISQSVLELGHNTSHDHSQSSQSEISKESESQLVSVIVTVVIFQLFSCCY